MDIDQRGDVIEPSEGGGQILLPSEAHPGIIHVLPYERPFVPGQAIPLVVNAETWLPTLKEIQRRQQNVLGLIAIRDRTEGVPKTRELYDMGTLCRVHRVHREDEQLHVPPEHVAFEPQSEDVQQFALGMHAPLHSLYPELHVHADDTHVAFVFSRARRSSASGATGSCATC